MATIMFDHAVKYGGRYYPANTPIEEIYECPQDDAEAAQDDQKEAETVETEETTEAKPEAAKKATKPRKKGDA